MKNISYQWKALSCSSLGAFFSVLSGTTIMLALPSIMKDLHADMSIITWVMLAYMLSLTILVPSIGRIADLYGRKKLFISGFVIFTIASLFCGLSHSGKELLFYRMIQGIGGALLVANSTTIITDAFDKKELGRALGVNSMIISVAAVFGPIIGGLLLKWGWRYIFFMNVPIGIIGSLWSFMQLKEFALPNVKKQKIDWLGSLMFMLGMLFLLIGLSIGGALGWLSLKTIFLFLVSLSILYLFYVHQMKIQNPMLDMRIVKNPFLASAFLCNLLNGIARGSISILLIFYFENIKGINPFQASLILTPFALAMMLVSPLSGYFADKYGEKHLSTAGLFLSAIGLIGFMEIRETTPIGVIIVWMVIMGAGSGMFISPNTSSIMKAVPTDKRGISAGIRTMMNHVGMMISIALSMGIIASSFLAPDAMESIMSGSHVNPQDFAVDKFISSIRMVFFISFLMSLFAAIISFVKGKQPSEEAVKVIFAED